MTLLSIHGLSRRFGGVVAVDDIDIELRRGELVAVIGPNGAGKTTLFNMVTGVIAPSTGRIIFDDRSLDGMPPHEIAALGIARTFQNLEVFDELTVRENVVVGCHRLGSAGVGATLLHMPGAAAEERRLVARAEAQLRRVGLTLEADTPAGALPFGQQRLVELARALALDPRLLLLDEPVAGLNRDEIARFRELVKELQDGGLTLVFIEHDMRTVMDTADRVVVLDRGRKIADGPPASVQTDDTVVAAYLGSQRSDGEQPG